MANALMGFSLAGDAAVFVGCAEASHSAAINVELQSALMMNPSCTRDVSSMSLDCDILHVRERGDTESATDEWVFTQVAPARRGGGVQSCAATGRRRKE